MFITITSCDDTIDYYAGYNVSIDALTIIAIPESNNGVDWDEDSEPDISFKVANGDGYIIYTCDSTLPDVNKEELPITFDIIDEYLTMVDHVYSIAFYEIDDNKDTIIGKAVQFNLQDLVNDYKEDRHVNKLPKTKRLENEYITVKVHLTWDDPNRL